MSGRGRGVSNKPAWMTRGGDAGPDNPGVPGMDPRDGFDNRGGPPGGFRGGPPGRGGPHGGFGGGRYDDNNFRGPPPPRDFRDRGRPFPPGRDFDRRGGGGRDFDRRDSRDSNFSRDRRGSGGSGGGGGGGGGGSNTPNHKNPGTIFFRSFEEEQQWVEERRRKRLARKSKFDVMPTPEQAAADAAMVALSNPAATDFAGINAADRNFSAVPQQTRHARRLYIGQLPPNVTEQELHVFFRDAIEKAIMPDSVGTVNGRLEEDPILSVYINHERRFCFLEFKSVEMTTACMELDGIVINGKGKVKVKRPNDYNPTMAPRASALPTLDTSKLGIISGTVPDGPNKIFVGGLHYHLTEDQVLELLQAFGKIKAFHLVKNDPDSQTSKGYCFAEYADPSVTQVAVMGLNGMDLGGGKMLTARVAGERGGATTGMSPVAAPAVAMLPAAAAAAAAASVADPNGVLPPHANIVHGYDVEAIVDAAMGQGPMPTAPMYLDSFGMPLTRLAPTSLVAAPASPMATQQQAGGTPTQPSALDIANAALAAAYGSPTAAAAPAGPPPTRVLVLSNMVLPDDLASDDDYQGLMDEVREECAKYGKLRGMNIPRQAGGPVQQSAILKIFLEYNTVQEAQAADKELKGRKFGDNVVQTSFYSEGDYAAGILS